MDIDFHPDADTEFAELWSSAKRDASAVVATITFRARDQFESGIPGRPLDAATADGRTVNLTAHLITEGRVTVVLVVADATGRGRVMAAGRRGFFAIHAEHRIWSTGVERAQKWIYEHGEI